MSEPDPGSEAVYAEKVGLMQAALEAAETNQASAEAVAARLSADVKLGASDEAVNSQAIDSLAVVDAAVEAPQVAGASLQQVKAQAVGLALLNAVNAQQNAYVAANATVVATVARILALGRGADAPADGQTAQGAKSSG